MISELKMAEMLCTRLCHDLTGPIGAVNNGAEFLQEEGFEMQSEAMELILSSASEAVNRLQFYRQAYGRQSEAGEASLSEKKQTVEDFFANTKIKIDWPDAHADASPVSVSQKMGRLILNLLIIASGVLLKGGTIAIRTQHEEGVKNTIHLTATGDIVKMDPDVLRILSREAALSQLTPKTVQLALTLTLTDEIGASLHFRLGDSKLDIEVEQPVLAANEAEASFA